MTAIFLSCLIAIAFVAALASLADSALRGARAYRQLKRSTPSSLEARVAVFTNSARVDVAALANTASNPISREADCGFIRSAQNDQLPAAA